MQVGVAEAVDRLLGVADKKERRAARAVDAVEDVELQRVGVLELVDECRWKARAQRLGQRFAIVGREALVQQREQVVEGDEALLALARTQRAAAVLDERAQQPQACQRQRMGGRLEARHQPLGQFEEGVRGRRLALVERGRHHAAAVQAGLFQHAAEGERVGAGAQLVPLERAGLDARRLEGVAVERTAPRMQRGDDVGPTRAPCRASRLVRTHQRVTIEVERSIDAIGPQAGRERLRQLPPQQPRPALGRVAARREQRRQRRVERVARHAAAPEVGDHLGQQRRVVGHQFERERHVRREWRVAQRALAEAVDREDRSLIEGLQGQVAALRQRGGLEAVVLDQRLEQLANEGVGLGRRRAVVRHPRQQRALRLGNAAADALAQLGGGRVGEGDDKDLFDAEPAFEQQPHVERADVPGLAGARRRLDQLRALERAVEDGEFLHRRVRGGVHCRPLSPAQALRLACAGARWCPWPPAGTVRSTTE